MKLVRALIIASHPIPSLAVTAMATLLTAEAAPAGFGAGRVVLVALAVLAGQLSVGWSNDAIDAERDAGRADKPAAVGLVSVRALWLGAAIAVVASLALAAALGPVSLAIDAAMTAVAWSYNLGLKSTALVRRRATRSRSGCCRRSRRRRCPGIRWRAGRSRRRRRCSGSARTSPTCCPTWRPTRATGCAGCRSGSPPGPARAPPGRPPWCCCWPPRCCCSSRPARGAGGRRSSGCAAPACSRWPAPRGRGKVPFLAAIGIAGVDVALFAAGVEALTSGPASGGRAGLMTQIVAVHSAFPAHRYSASRPDPGGRVAGRDGRRHR